MSEKDVANLLAILDAVEKIQLFVEEITDADGFYEDIKTFDAVLMNFILIGETTVKISDELKIQTAHIDWRNIKNFRNLIAHNYFGVDAEEVWEIINNYVPILKKDVQALIGN